MKRKNVKLIRFAFSFIILYSTCVITASANPENLNYIGKSYLKKLDERYAGAYEELCKGILSHKSKIDLSAYELSKDELMLVYSVHKSDHPQHYKVLNNYVIGYINSVVSSVQLNYNDNYNDSLFETKANKIINSVNASLNQFDKALQIHDLLVKNVSYDVNASNIHNAYGALVDGKAVCDGYAAAYEYLLQQFGIECYSVIGMVKGCFHQWNVAKLDGKYYHIDVCWDDPDSANESVKPVYHAYFALNTEQISYDHTIDDKYSIVPLCPDSGIARTGVTVVNNYSSSIVANALKIASDNAVANIYFDGKNDNFNNWFAENKLELLDISQLANKVDTIYYSSCGRQHIIRFEIDNNVNADTQKANVVSNSSSPVVSQSKSAAVTEKTQTANGSETAKTEEPAEEYAEAESSDVAFTQNEINVSSDDGNNLNETKELIELDYENEKPLSTAKQSSLMSEFKKAERFPADNGGNQIMIFDYVNYFAGLMKILIAVMVIVSVKRFILSKKEQ